MSNNVKITEQDLARILDPALRDPALEARRLATLARLRAQASAQTQAQPTLPVRQAGD